MNQLSLTIAIPAYNEQAQIENAVTQADYEASLLTKTYEVLVLNDGSSDKTKEILSQLRKRFSHLRVLDHSTNQGLESSLKELYSQSKYPLTFFNGADNEIAMNILPHLVKKLNDGYDVVVARRIAKKYNLYRLIVSWLFNFLIRITFGFDPYDAGCAKLFKTRIYQSLNSISATPFGEAERLIRSHEKGYKIGFVFVPHQPKVGQSSIKLKHIVLSFWDMLKVLWDVKFGTFNLG